MDNHDDTTEPGPAHLERMREEFRRAQSQRLMTQGIALWNRTVAQAAAAEMQRTPETRDNHTTPEKLK